MNRFKPITKKLNFDKDKRIFRIIFMLNKLNDGNLNIDDMCLEFNTTKRTIYRDLSLIRICGFHIESLGNGNYCFSEGISLKDRDISDEQLASLMLLYEVSKNIGGKIHSSFVKLFENIVKSSPWSEKNIIPLIPKLINQKDIPFIDDLELAIKECKEIEIEYYLESSDKIIKHTICPLKILFSEGFNYLLSMINDKKIKKFPRFRVDKIKSINFTGKVFVPPHDIDSFIKKARNIWGAMPKKNRTIKVRLEIKGWARDYFYFQEIVGGQKTYFNNSGDLIFEAKVCQIQEVLHHIMRNLPMVKIIEPQELIEEVKTRITKTLKEIENKHF